MVTPEEYEEVEKLKEKLEKKFGKIEFDHRKGCTIQQQKKSKRMAIINEKGVVLELRKKQFEDD